MNSTCLWAPPVYELHLSMSSTCMWTPPVYEVHILIVPNDGIYGNQPVY